MSVVNEKPTEKYLSAAKKEQEGEGNGRTEEEEEVEVQVKAWGDSMNCLQRCHEEAQSEKDLTQRTRLVLSCIRRCSEAFIDQARANNEFPFAPRSYFWGSSGKQQRPSSPENDHREVAPTTSSTEEHGVGQGKAGAREEDNGDGDWYKLRVPDWESGWKRGQEYLGTGYNKSVDGTLSLLLQARSRVKQKLEEEGVPDKVTIQASCHAGLFSLKMKTHVTPKHAKAKERETV
jgi:hypothetical protein